MNRDNLRATWADQYNRRNVAPPGILQWPRNWWVEGRVVKGSLDGEIVTLCEARNQEAASYIAALPDFHEAVIGLSQELTLEARLTQRGAAIQKRDEVITKTKEALEDMQGKYQDACRINQRLLPELAEVRMARNLLVMGMMIFMVTTVWACIGWQNATHAVAHPGASGPAQEQAAPAAEAAP